MRIGHYHISFNRKILIYTIFALLFIGSFLGSYVFAIGFEKNPGIGVMIPDNNYEQPWYIEPETKTQVALGGPRDAFNIMRRFGIGIKHFELENYFKNGFPENLAAKILIDVEKNGQAYYISPFDLRAHFLGRPNFALLVLKENGFLLSNQIVKDFPLDNPLADERRKIEDVANNDLIEIFTKPISSVDSFSKIVSVGGDLIKGDLKDISELGVVWSFDTNPLVSDNKIIAQKIDKVFSVAIDNVVPEKKYYIRSYAIYKEEIIYGNEENFLVNKVNQSTSGAAPQAINLPSIGTTSVNISGVDSLSAGGVITNDGGGPIINKGVCFSASPSPTINDLCVRSSSESTIFSTTMTNLDPEVNYYVRAYATNSKGTSYGNEFITCGSTTVLDSEGHSYNIVKIGSQCWTKESLNLGTYVASAAAAPCTDYIDPAVPGTHYWSCQNDDNTIEKYCYSNNQANCSTDGALYEWQEALALPARCVYESCSSLVSTKHQGICPTGWHIPSDEELATLEQRVVQKIASPNTQYPCGTSTDYDRWWLRRCADDNGTDNGGVYGAGKSLKKTGQGSGDGAGDDLVGFSAILGGYRSWVDGGFVGRGSFFDIWTTKEHSISGMPFYAWDRELQSSITTIGRDTGVKSYGFHVRCLKN